MPKQHIEPFTQLPHWIWKEKIKPFAKLMLFAIYRMTAGFHRDTCKISDADITELTGIKAPKPIRDYLIERKYFTYEHENGMTGIYTIPPPNRIRHSPKLNSGDPQNKLNGYQRAKVNIKDKLKESTLTDDLLVKMKSKYPKIDVNAVKDKMLNYYNGKSVPLGYKFKEWCAREKVGNGVTVVFKLDSTGFPIGWCAKCNVLDFYKFEELKGDSRCCNSNILPSKRPV